MLDFRLWFEKEEIPENAIKAALPKVRQKRPWSCGHQAFRAICKYFNTGPHEEDDYIKFLGGNSDDGLWPEAIIKGAKKLGFNVKSKTGMNLDEIKHFLDKKIPVLVAMQSWGEPKNYDKSKAGHYVVVIGYDNTNLYFEDPSLDGKRGVLDYKSFVKRWHDIDAHGHQCNQLGIAMWKQSIEPHKKLTQARELE